MALVIMEKRILALIGAYYCLRRKTEKRKRRWHVHPLNVNRRNQGDWHHLVNELRLDSSKFYNYFRMSSEAFDNLLQKIGSSIQKVDHFRETIAEGQRLALTLRFLASGDSIASLSYAYRIGKSTASVIITETCECIWQKLKADVFMELTETCWLRVAEEMKDKWNFPHCIGALDGKHVVIQAPPNCGSTYFNYKGAHSIVLMGIADASYKFIMVDIGATGRRSDGGIFKTSQMGTGFENAKFNVPSKELICDTLPPLPYVLVADEAFQLSSYIMRPYPGRQGLDIQRKIFNYRLSRCRRLIENTFGIMAGKFRILRKPIIGGVRNIIKYVQTITCLHNYIIIQEHGDALHQHQYISPKAVDRENADGTVIEGEWRHDGAILGLQDIHGIHTGSNRAAQESLQVREYFTHYFTSDEGSVEWQWDRI